MEQNHVASLLAKHAGIEAQIDHEISRPAPDMVAINRLKKEKLRIKDTLVSFAPV